MPCIWPRKISAQKDLVIEAAYPGPAELPFEHHDVRAYLDNLFLEGLLEPVEHFQSQALSETWVALGVRIDPEADHQKRLERLYSALQDSLPSCDARHGDWLTFAKSWAEFLALWLEKDSEPVPGMGDKVVSLQLEPAYPAGMAGKDSKPCSGRQ